MADLKQQTIQLLQRLIATKSYSENEGGTAAHLKDWCDHHKIRYQTNGHTVWATNEHYDPKRPTLLLNSHHDTVYPNQAYTRDPFDPVIEDGKLYGLGSNDAGALVDAFGARLTLVEGCFGDMEALAQDAGFAELDGVMLDLGVSSMQLDQPARGFSFMRDGPLDMRMGATGTSAEELVNEADPALLVSILSVYGEERRARAIVRALVVRRETARITRTGELAEIVCSVLGQPRGKGAHPATRTFQALRIYLNDELGELLRGLHAAERLLRPGGRLVVVTFHSLEDRMVKKFLANRSGRAGRPSRYLPEQAGPASSFEELPKRTQKAGADELARNSRARSARLRGAVRTTAPAFPEDESLLPAGAPKPAQYSALGGRP